VGKPTPLNLGEYMEHLPAVIPSFENSDQVSFLELEQIFKRALKAERVSATIAQAFFSTIILRNRWKEAKVWADPVTGMLYHNPDEIPEGIQTVQTEINRFTSIEDWIKTLSKVKGFSRSTCYMRHAEIVRQMDYLNRPFEVAVNSVMTSPGHSRLILDKVMLNDFFIPEEVVKLLPPLQRDEKLKEISEGDTASICREIILKQLEIDEARMAEGDHPRTVIGDIKRMLGNFAKYTLRLSDKGRSFVITEDKKGIIKKYFVLIESEDPREHPPLDVIHWLAWRMKIRIK
jgi:hypothetical protein